MRPGWDAAMRLNDKNTACKVFSGSNGEEEYFISVKAPGTGTFRDQLKAVEQLYAGTVKTLDLAPASAIFRRVFLSDIRSQEIPVRRSGLAARGEPVAVSIIEQPPLAGGDITLLAYHIRGRAPLVKKRLSPRHLLVEKNGFGHLWSAGLRARGGKSSPQGQTRAVFTDLVRALQSRGGNLKDHCVRTWIYLDDIEANYKGMVDARRELFAGQGLTGDTHYIASTGIEGRVGGTALIGLDAYSILGLQPRQVSYLNDFSRLCPAKDYNVTFERGTRVAYADRCHLFVSGTASIDGSGRILHPGNALKQLGRAVENIEALLKSGRATMADLTNLTVYLRDPGDLPRVAGYLKERFRDLPLALVRGAVCRPGWLVEVEGSAVTVNHAPSLPSF